MATVIVRAYDEDGNQLATATLNNLSASTNYTVYGIYGAFVNASGFSPTTAYVETKGSNLARVNGVSKSTYSSTTSPSSDSNTLGFRDDVTNWVSFYYEAAATGFTQSVYVINETTGGILDSGSFTAYDGDRYTIQSAMNAAWVTIPSGYAFTEATLNGSTYYSSLSSAFYANSSYKTLYVYCKVPVTTITLRVNVYHDGLLYDYGTCTRTIGTQYTIANCMSAAGVETTGVFDGAAYKNVLYTSLSSNITIDEYYTTLNVNYKTETVNVTVSLYVGGTLQDSEVITKDVGSRLTVAQIVSAAGFTIDPNWAFSKATYNGATYTSLSSSITFASGVTTLRLDYILARSVIPYIYHSGAWHEVSNVYLYHGGAWREPDLSFYIGGAWK